MKHAAQFAGALLAAVLLHLVCARWVDEWSLVADLMLLVVVFNALDGNTLSGMAGGLVAGWATDVLMGSPFGLFGVVDTIIGYGAAYAVQRIVIQHATGAALFFAAATLCQQGLLLGLSLLLLVSPETSAYSWLPIKVGAMGVLGGVLFHSRRRLASRVDLWRHTRHTRIRLEK